MAIMASIKKWKESASALPKCLHATSCNKAAFLELHETCNFTMPEMGTPCHFGRRSYDDATWQVTVRSSSQSHTRHPVLLTLSRYGLEVIEKHVCIIECWPMQQ